MFVLCETNWKGGKNFVWKGVNSISSGKAGVGKGKEGCFDVWEMALYYDWVKDVPIEKFGPIPALLLKLIPVLVWCKFVIMYIVGFIF